MNLIASETLFEFQNSRFAVLDKSVKRVDKLIDDKSSVKKRHLAYFKSGSFSGFDLFIDYGPSGDPSFYLQKQKKHIFIGAGEDIKMMENADMYVSSRLNKYFKVTRKYVFKTGAISLVKQPYLYAGLSSKVNKDFKIYSDKENTLVIDSLRRGEDVFVILCDKDVNCLIKTQRDIIGWRKIKLTEAYFPLENNIIKDFYFLGD